MTDPVADYEESLKKIEGKKSLAIESLQNKLRDQRAEVRKTEARIAELEGRDAGKGKRQRKKSGYKMTPEHKEAMRAAREKKKKARK